MTQGINVPAVTAWLGEHIDVITPPVSFDPIPGGRSNLTYIVTDATGRRVVLRRPPMSHVLSTAHDMGREHRIISALRGTGVPVPDALGFCADEAVNDRPFYVMDFVDGYVFRSVGQTAAVLDEVTRMVAGDDLIDVLVAIHAVDVDAVGLGNLARRDGYIERQLRRWHGQFEQSQQQAREVGVYRPVPLVPQAHRLLAERVPEQRGVAIVHGDYRIDNVIMSGQGRVRAVLDWELCTLGDPLADVGILLAYWAERPAEPGGPAEPGEPGGLGGAGGQAGATSDGAARMPALATTSPEVTALPGFPTRAELAARYAARSGRDLSDIGFYLAFAYWKLACILEGVFVRYAARAMGGGHDDAEVLSQGVEDRARRAIEALEA